MVREATLDDVPQLAEMGARFVTETAYASHLQVCRERIAETATMLVRGPTSVVFVHEPEGRAVNGMMALATVKNLWDGSLMASELVWWVEPEARTGLAGIRLLRAAEQWARAAGAVRLTMIAPSDRVEAFFVRAGYDKLETAYEKSLGG